MSVRAVWMRLALACLVATGAVAGAPAQMARPDIAATELPDGSWDLAPGAAVGLFHALSGTPVPDGAARVDAGDGTRLYRLRVPFALRAGDGSDLRLEPLLGFLGTSATAGGARYTVRLPLEAARLTVTGTAAERLRPLVAGGGILAGDLLFQVASVSESGEGGRVVEADLRRILLSMGNRDMPVHAIDVSPAAGAAASSAAMSQAASDAPLTPPVASAPPPLPVAITQPVAPPPLPSALTSPSVPVPPAVAPVADATPPVGNAPPLPAAIPPVAIFQPPAAPAVAPDPAPAPSAVSQPAAQPAPPAIASSTPAPGAADAPARSDDPVLVAERAGVLRNAPSMRALQVGQVRAGQRFALVKEAKSNDGVAWAEVKPLPDGASGFVPRRDLVTLDDWQTPVRGPVARIVDAATLVVGERTVVLGGVEAGPKRLVEIVRPWLSGAASPLACERRPDAAFDCFSADKRDVGETMILNGLAKAGPGAADYYREAEDKARAGKKGMWRGAK